MSSQHFRTKVDWFFVMIYMFLGVRLFTPVVTAVVQGRSFTPAVDLVSAWRPRGAVTTWRLARTYVLTDTMLLVKSGPFTSRIPVASIYKLRATHTIVASPALSLDRIEVLARQGPYTVISPADKRGFIAAVRQRVPALELEGLETAV